MSFAYHRKRTREVSIVGNELLEIATDYPHGLRKSALPAGLRTIDIERQALDRLHESLGVSPLCDSFQDAAELIANAQGRVVVSGMGKSGLVGRKIAATLASTGTPSLFIHPADAGHGDLGMIARGDIVLALSWSGETTELSDIITYCQRFAIPLVAITACAESNLGTSADIVLMLPKVQEACPNRLAPTSSTVLQAAIGDALAVALIEVRGFSPDDFRVFHPKGRLGAQLLRVSDVMATGDSVPFVNQDATILAAMVEMSLKRFGITGIVDESGRLVGVFTDGDLRRSLTTATVDAPVCNYMTESPLMIEAHQLASEALAVMNDRNVMQLFVGAGDDVRGIIHVHDILREGVI